jgi:DNA-binding winged helix-turn-helix (wHTH) protein
VIGERRVDAEAPWVDQHGLVWYHGRWVALSDNEARVVRTLLDAGGALVSQDRLLAPIWPEATPDAGRLHSLMLRVRRRIRPLGLQVRCVRGQGFLLEDTTELAQRTHVSGAR